MISVRSRLAFGAAMAIALAALAAPVASAGEPIVTTDLLRIRSASAIEVAWDGSVAIVAVRSIGAPPGSGDDASGGGGSGGGGSGGVRVEHVNQSHLYRLDLGNPAARPRQLTFGDRNDRAPALSPDGKLLAFVRGREDGAGAPQVWLLPVDGGEAQPLTDLPRGAGAPRWAPDGRSLLVTSDVPIAELPGPPPWASERPGRDHGDAPAAGVVPRPDGTREEIRAWLAENAAAENPTVITRLRFQDEQALRGPASFRQLFLVDVANRDAAPRPLTRAHRDHDDAAFMPDGAAVVYAAKRDDAAHPDRVWARSLRRVTVEGGEDRELLAADGWSFSDPRPSQDGSVLAFTARETDEPAYRQTRLGIVSLGVDGASEPVWLTDPQTLDASVRAIDWMPTRSAVLFTVARRGGFSLMTMGLGLLEPATLVDEEGGHPVGVHAFGAGGGVIAYSVTSWRNPCVIRVRDARGDRLAFDLNAWVAEKTLARPRAGTVTRPDGTVVPYWLMEPARREAGVTYPLALEIHGGPSAMWGPGEFTMWHEFQLLCSFGYGVAYANPRGSGGYGYGFQKANFQNWGDGPAGDVLAVVDQALLETWVDANRLVVTGGSYGGYLTAWIVAHDNRFKAAVAQRGVYDLATFFGEGNAWQLLQWSMGGYPWDPRMRPVLQRESPFQAVSRIRTPLLIMHGSEDLRTGVSQSEMLYRALKVQGRPVEYVRYPGAGHDLSRTGDPRQRMDRLSRIVEFFDRHVANETPAPVAR